ncbi:MAG: response regulator [Planctomycetes bacterium]|nr:response regulator [Planctomycetota bacterium]
MDTTNRQFRGSLQRRMSVVTLCAILLPSAAGCVALYLHARHGIRKQIEKAEQDIRGEITKEIEHLEKRSRDDLVEVALVLAQETVDLEGAEAKSRINRLAGSFRRFPGISDLRIDMADGQELVPAEGPLSERFDHQGLLLYEIDRGGEVVGWVRILPDHGETNRHIAVRRAELETRVQEAYQWATEREAQYLMFTAMVFLGLVGCAISTASSFLRKFVLRRINALLAVCRRVAERDYDARADANGVDELSELGSNFNWMTQQVGHTHDRLETQVRHRTEELHRANSELRVALEEARQAARAKSEFLAVMSHELRTPLNGVLGMAQILQTSNLDDEQTELVEEISSSGGLLIRIINDILDFTKAGAGKIRLEEQEMDLEATIDEVMGVVGEKATEKDLPINVLYGEGVPARVIGDPLRLQQVLLNLLGNAVKFTAEGEVALQVTLETREGDDVALGFAIRDTGLGIPADKQADLFEPFTQADRGTTRNFGGTGLGLAISKSLVNLMGGDIEIESELGAGSVFRFQVILKAVSASATSRSELDGLRGLVVSGHPTTRQSLEMCLTRLGARVCGAGSIEEARRATGIDFVVGHFGRDDETIRTNIEALRSGLGTEILVVVVDRAHSVRPSYQGELGNGSAIMRPARRDPLIRALRSLVTGQPKQPKPVVLAPPVASNAPPPPADTPDDPNPFALVFGETTSSGFETAMESKSKTVAPPAKAAPRILPSRETVPPTGRESICVLVAEDNPVNRKVAQMMLQQIGFTVVLANDGAEAVDRFRQGDIDAVIMDCDMPRMDGFDATRYIRQTGPHGHRIPIIALTASAMPSDKDRCLESGMDDMLAKPVRTETLEETITHWLDVKSQA